MNEKLNAETNLTQFDVPTAEKPIIVTSVVWITVNEGPPGLLCLCTCPLLRQESCCHSETVNRSPATVTQGHTPGLHHGNAINNGPGFRIGVEKCEGRREFTHIFQNSDVV
jgi:hypothetical protein